MRVLLVFMLLVAAAQCQSPLPAYTPVFLMCPADYALHEPILIPCITPLDEGPRDLLVEFVVFEDAGCLPANEKSRTPMCFMEPRCTFFGNDKNGRGCTRVLSYHPLTRNLVPGVSVSLYNHPYCVNSSNWFGQYATITSSAPVPVSFNGIHTGKSGSRTGALNVCYETPGTRESNMYYMPDAASSPGADTTKTNGSAPMRMWGVFGTMFLFIVLIY